MEQFYLEPVVYRRGNLFTFLGIYKYLAFERYDFDVSKFEIYIAVYSVYCQ